MITKNDCIVLLTDLEEQGMDVTEYVMDVLKAQGPTEKSLKFINDNRQLDLTNFYRKIRKSYNNGHSELYINIVREVEDANSVLTTLSALQTQLLLFARDVDDREMFLRHARAEEIAKSLMMYYNTFDLTNCIRLLRVIKCDIKALESIL